MLRPLLLSLPLALGLFAATAAQAGDHGFDAKSIDARCAEQPEKCERIRARAAEVKAKCDADPVKCEERRKAREERRAEWKKECDADPAACEARKAKARERMEKRRAERAEKAGAR